MSLLLKGISRLSELLIDADKVWRDAGGNPRGITNIKEVATGMVIGSLAEHDGHTLFSFLPGPDGYAVTSQGPGKKLVFAPPGGGLKYYFPISIDSDHAEAVVTPDHSIAKNAALASVHKEAYGDAPADLIKMLTPTLGGVDSVTMKAAADQLISKSFPMHSGLSILCDGFVEETAAAVQTDKTAQARDAAANDLNLNPMTPAIGDKVYVGSTYPFWQAQVLTGTVGVGNWLNAWYYWNGAWVPVVNEVDGSNQWLFGSTTLTHISHDVQGDWIPCVIQGMNLYWLMCDTVGFVNQITAPLGSQVWVAIA